MNRASEYDPGVRPLELALTAVVYAVVAFAAALMMRALGVGQAGR